MTSGFWFYREVNTQSDGLYMSRIPQDMAYNIVGFSFLQIQLMVQYFHYQLFVMHQYMLSLSRLL